MEQQDLALSGKELAIMPVMDIKMALNRREQITAFIKAVMTPGVDYGIIPGTGDRPGLFKPGAEKLTTLFGLSKRFTVLEKIEDWDGAERGGEPFFYYIYRCALYRGELLIAEADGSCNSHESKYRYRKAERTCPSCGQAAIVKGKTEYGGGWLCWKNKGGCGAKFRTGDTSIESQEVGRVLNKDVADQANTLLKMAQKRALVAATLLAINGSEYFSTKEMPGFDEDDAQIIDGQAIDVTPTEQPQPAKTNGNPKPAQPQPVKPNGNIPTSPQALLDYINPRIEATYDNLFHLQGGIQKELGDNWKWPKPNDTAGWQAAYDAAYKHAVAKTKPVEQPAPETGSERDKFVAASEPTTEEELPF